MHRVRKFMLVISCISWMLPKTIHALWRKLKKAIQQWTKPTGIRDRNHKKRQWRNSSNNNKKTQHQRVATLSCIHWVYAIASMRNATYGLSVTCYEHNRLTHNSNCDQNANRKEPHTHTHTNKPERSGEWYL